MLADLLSGSLETDFDESWENERTANALTDVAVRVRVTGCSLREIRIILRFLGVERSHQAIFQCMNRLSYISPDPPTFTRAKLSCSQPERFAFW